MRTIITNVVYGETYADIFLNQHLKSLLDESNIPQMNGEITYVIFTDDETKPLLEKHVNMKRLLSLCEVEIRDFTWRPDVNRFGLRYNVLINTFIQSVKLALERDSLLCAWVADLVFAQNFLPKVMDRMSDGHDAVFVLPARSAAEAIKPYLDKMQGAIPADELWNLCYKNLHPLWVACHWDTPQFTSRPFTLLWNSTRGLLARSYSITPIIFKPTQEMLDVKAVIDVDVPGLCKNPYWCEDWDEAPVIGVEPICCYYPPFDNKPAGEWIRDWSMRLNKTQLPFLKKHLYYPNKRYANIPQEMAMASDTIVNILSVRDK